MRTRCQRTAWTASRRAWAIALGAWLLVVLAAGGAEAPRSRYAGVPEYAQRRIDVAELRAARRTGRIALPLPGGREGVFTVEQERETGGIRTIRAAAGTDRLLLTTDGIGAYGHATVAGADYVIDTDARQVLVADAARVAGQRLAPRDDAVVDDELVARLLPDFSALRQQAAMGHKLESGAGPTVVDIAVFYDAGIGALSPDVPHLYAQYAVDFTNEALAGHGVGLELRLVHVGPFPGSLGSDPFAQFVDNPAIDDLGRPFGADLLHLVFLDYPYESCGEAYLVGRYGVSGSPDCGVRAFAHEIGHNFGAHHERAIVTSNVALPINQYNFGYYCGGSGTLMTYSWTQLPHYSDPYLSHYGQACGVAAGQPDAADNARVLAEMAGRVAGFRPAMPVHGSVWIVNDLPASVAEEATPQLNVRLRRDGDLSRQVSVEFAAIPVAAQRGADYQVSEGRVVFAPGEAERSIALLIVDDDEYESAAEEFTLALRYPLGLAVTGGSRTISITSGDPDPGWAEFEVTTWSGEESAGTVPVRLTRRGPSNASLTVTVSATDGTARQGVDYRLLQSSVTFGPGEVEKQVGLVAMVDDSSKQGCQQRHFWLGLIGGAAGQVNMSFYVTDDDMQRGQFQLATPEYVVRETDHRVQVGVERVGGVDCRITGQISSRDDGTAVAELDFRPATGGFAMDSAHSFAYVWTTILDDSRPDGERWFSVELQADDPAWLGDRTTARVTIADDELLRPEAGRIGLATSRITVREDVGAALATVRRTGGSSGAAIVEYTTDIGSAVPGDFAWTEGTLRWTDGDASDRVVAIPIVDDQEQEPVESLLLRLNHAAGAAVDKPVVVIDILNNDGNSPPQPPASLPEQSATEGVGFGYTVAPFADADGDALTYRFTGLPAWLKVCYPQSNPRYLCGKPPYSEASPGGNKPYTLVVEATDPSGLSGQAVLPLTVQHANAPPLPPAGIPGQVATEGVGIGFTVPAFTDVDGDALAYQFTGLPAWLGVCYPQTNARYLCGKPPFSEAPPGGSRHYAIMVQATDPHAASASHSLALVVHHANAAPAPPASIPGQVATENVGIGFTVPAFTDVDGDALAYRFTGLPGWLGVCYPQINPRYLCGKPPLTAATPRNPARHVVTVQATDPYRAGASRSFTLTVNDAP